MPRFQTVEEGLVKLGLTCKVCNQPVKQIPDMDATPRYYDQGKDTVGRCFVIAYPTKPHLSGLCYFHQKKKEGLFDRLTFNQIVKQKLKGGNNE